MTAADWAVLGDRCVFAFCVVVGVLMATGVIG